MTSQKKAITYGKASRKSTPDKGAVAADEIARHSIKGCWGDTQRRRGGANDNLPDSILQPKPDPMTYHSNNLELPCRPSTAFNNPGIGKPQHKPYLSLRHASASPKKDIMTAGRAPDALLYGRLSGQEDCGSQISKAGGFRRKKEKHIIPEVVAEDATCVYDDESLQRHVAAEISIDQSRYQQFQGKLDLDDAKSKLALQMTSQADGHEQNPRSQPLGKRHPDQSFGTSRMTQRTYTDRNTFKSNVITVAMAVDSTQNKREGLLRGSSQAHQTRNLDGSSQRRTSQYYMPESCSRSDLPASAPHGKCERPSIATAKVSGPLTTPPRVVVPNAVTTPRQRELWHKLLKDNTEQPMSIALNPAGNAIEDRDKNTVPKSGFCAENSILLKTVYNNPHKRRRLVDNLLGDDGDPEYTDGSSQVKSDASFNLRPANSGTDATLYQSDPVSIDAEDKGLPDHAPVLPSHIHQAPLHQGGEPKVTYARQRSYLTDDNLGQTGILDMPIVNELGPGARKRRQGTSEVKTPFLHQGNLVENQIDATESQGSAMRSIHELREAGGNARVYSEMEAILDDIDEANTTSSTLKRSRLLYLAIKLQDPSFCRLFIDQGLDQRLFDYLGSTNDILVEALFAAILLRLLATSTFISKLSHVKDSSVKGYLTGLLDKDQDLRSSLSNRSFNLSKATQADFKNFWDLLLLKSTAWRAGRPTVLTPCVISLQCLEYLVRHAREMGRVNAVLSRADISSVVRFLKPDLSYSLLQPSPRPTVEMHLSVSILESCTISTSIPCEETPWTGQTLDTTVRLLPLLDGWLKEDVGTLRTLTLRLYLNLTNNNPTLCKAFSRPDVIGSMLNIIVSHFQRLSENDTLNKPEVLLDNLILSLGSMINLAEWCDTVRPLVLSLHSGDSCFLDTLIQLFTSKQQKVAEVFSEKETSFNVAFGYLSVLLSYLCVNQEVRLRVSSRLRGRTLGQLLDAVDEFLHYHRQIDEEIYQDDGEMDVKAGFIDRLQRMVNELKLEQRRSA
ncbi:hypothetical protein MMC07_009860 [Pseudocyphellaria aurata]|nr:hypothetical protein [Pseudocyphellaria aurata]